MIDPTHSEGGDPLRPRNWDDFVGQQAAKERLDINIKAALIEGRPLDHVLLAGPAGFGKTSLAQIIAAQLGDPITFLTMPMNMTEFVDVIRNFSGGILFVDEIHLAGPLQNALRQITEEGAFTEKSGRKIHIPFLTVIAATTEPHELIRPLIDRFPIQPLFEDPYPPEDMAQIVLGLAKRLRLTMDPVTAEALGRAAGGTPRNAKRLVLAYRDLSHSLCHEPTAAEVLSQCNTDPDGLSALQLQYLQCLDKVGGKAGLRTLVTHLRRDESVLLEYERLLIANELIELTGQGRKLTPQGRRRLAGEQAPVIHHRKPVRI